MIQEIKTKHASLKRIREAINNYPGGLCFAMPDGRPILANKTINQLCVSITGHTVLNMNEEWTSWKRCAVPNEQVFLEGQPDDSIFICRIGIDGYWQFKKTCLEINNTDIFQYEATDVTKLYQYRSHLMENNIRVKELLERRKELLENIVRINLEKELLGAKMRIHDDFNRLLIITKNAFQQKPDHESAKNLFSAWENVITDFENATISQSQKEVSPQKELVQVADMIGCKVSFYGKQPSERNALLLLYAVIREALTNAVRHAGADLLSVFIEEDENEYHVRIENNGKVHPDSIQEGGGLGSLRKRLESEGASLDILCEDGVVLSIKIPRR